VAEAEAGSICCSYELRVRSRPEPMPIAVRVRSVMSVVSTAPRASVHDGFQNVVSSRKGVDEGMCRN
jgi:hypothetical protein